MSASNARPQIADADWQPDCGPQTPRHGNQGDRATPSGRPRIPLSLTIAFSRETGSRGGTIAGRVGRKLGWQVYNQELLEYIVQESGAREGLSAHLPSAAAAWPDEQMARLRQVYNLDARSADLARIVLTLGAQGEVILVGRGTPYILPRQSTLNVRIIAPLEDRIAYMSQWQRLTLDQAAERVRQRDQQRAEFLATHFHRPANDLYQYDLLLNSSLLGEDLCAELIALAARAKLAAMTGGDEGEKDSG